MKLQMDARTTEILQLEQATDNYLCGGKASSLADMMALQLPVPPGFVITNTVFQEFLESGYLKDKIQALLSPIEKHETEKLKTASKTIREWLLAVPLPSTVLKRAEAIWHKSLGGKTVIVRSSGVGEDSIEASYAGQLDSFLDIDTIYDLEHAIKACWASYWSERAVSYQMSTGVRLNGMGVIVQRQIESALAGVLFTCSPIPQSSHDSKDMLGEYCFGQGESLVSGKINPGRFQISRESSHWEKLTEPEQRASINSGIDLTVDSVLALRKAALRLEQHFNRPQDIEWSIDNSGNVFIVQSRPIVSCSVAPQGNLMITWTNANVRENFPDPITPLLYSVASAGYTYYFRNLAKAFGISQGRIAAMDASFASIIGVHGARMYYNLTSIHAVIRIAPFGDYLVKYFNNFVGASETPPLPHDAMQFHDTKRSRVAQVLELIRILGKTTWQFLFLDKRVTIFERTIDDFASDTDPSTLNTCSVTVLRDHLRTFMDIRLNRWTNAALADTASMICYGVLQSLLRKFFPAEDQASLSNSLLKGVTGLVSSEPVLRLWALSRIIRDDKALTDLFCTKPSVEIVRVIRDEVQNDVYHDFIIAFEDFLEKWGYRCSGELMLTVPSFQEDSTGLIDILKTYVKLDSDSPLEVLQSQKAEREELTQVVLAKLSRKKGINPVARLGSAFLVKRCLMWTQKAISLRERARLKQALLYSRLRRISLSMGEKFVEQKLINEPGDIFYLNYLEIDDLASSRAMFPNQIKNLIVLRKKEHELLGAMALPDSFEMEEGTYLEPSAFDSTENTNEQDAMDMDRLQGTTACGGKVKGRATVLRDLTESDQLKNGDILVTTQTDPGWAHVFFLIKGLVIERGGMLSHGAILAREFGIPAVVGIRKATDMIPQHSEVFLDGDSGYVQVLE